MQLRAEVPVVEPRDQGAILDFASFIDIHIRHDPFDLGPDVRALDGKNPELAPDPQVHRDEEESGEDDGGDGQNLGRLGEGGRILLGLLLPGWRGRRRARLLLERLTDRLDHFFEFTPQEVRGGHEEQDEAAALIIVGQEAKEDQEDDAQG